MAAYELTVCLEFRRVLFRSLILEHQEFDAGEFQMTTRQLLVDHELRTRDVELPVGDERGFDEVQAHGAALRRTHAAELRSEERRVGKERRSRGLRDH